MVQAGLEAEPNTLQCNCGSFPRTHHVGHHVSLRIARGATVVGARECGSKDHCADRNARETRHANGNMQRMMSGKYMVVIEK
jgi:hypothetical protein